MSVLEFVAVKAEWILMKFEHRIFNLVFFLFTQWNCEGQLVIYIHTSTLCGNKINITLTLLMYLYFSAIIVEAVVLS